MSKILKEYESQKEIPNVDRRNLNVKSNFVERKKVVT